MKVSHFLLSALITELFKADKILSHAFAMMTPEQQKQLARKCKKENLMQQSDEATREPQRAFLFQQVAAEVDSIGVCRQCGCTDFCGCPSGCYWAEPDLCSVCSCLQGGVK